MLMSWHMCRKQCRKVNWRAEMLICSHVCELNYFSALFCVQIWKNAWFWKVWKVTPWYTKLPMYVCFECWLAPMKFKQAFFSRAFFDFFDYFSTLDECLDIFDEFFDPRYARAEKYVPRHSSCVEKYVEKISKSTWKKNAHLNFISARQHSQQTYINSYLISEKIKKYRKCPPLFLRRLRSRTPNTFFITTHSILQGHFYPYG